jgi:hypothetical protein
VTVSASSQVLAPSQVGKAAPTGTPREFLKMLLPRRTVRKGDQTLRFNDSLFGELIRAEQTGAFDSIPLQVAEHHTDLPQYTEGQVSGLQVLENGPDGPGLYGKVAFATDKAAEMVAKNPKVGVSVRMVQNLEREEDGQKHSWRAALKHVLLTTDPHVRKMGGWTPATDLDREHLGDVIDLQFDDTEETPVTEEKKTADGAGDRVTLDLSREEFAGLSELLSDLKAAKELAGGRGPAGDGGTGGGSPAPGSVDLDREDESGSNTLDLMRAEIATERTARLDLERELRTNKAERELDALLQAGVAPALVDLARPVYHLGVGGETVVDLDRGNGRTTKVDTGKVVRELFAAFVDLSHQGLAVIDLDSEEGMNAWEDDGDRAQNKALADAFDAQFPIN